MAQDTNPDFFENDVLDYDVYQCGKCADNHSSEIFFDHLSNDNICNKCLHEEDLPFILGMNCREFDKYKNKVIKQLPSNPL